MSRDLEAWIADMGKAEDELHDKARGVAEKGALNVKNGWRARWEGHPTIRHLPAAVTYDITADEDTFITYQIGPDKDLLQGPLGNIIEFGTVNNAPIEGGMPALDAEEPGYVRAVEDLGEQLLAGKA